MTFGTGKGREIDSGSTMQPNGCILSTFVISVTSGVEATRCRKLVVAAQSAREKR